MDSTQFGTQHVIPECPFCRLTPAQAWNTDAGFPMAEVMGTRPNGEPDIWIHCDCMNRVPASLFEEKLRRHEALFGKSDEDFVYDGLADVIWAESWGKKDPNVPPSSENSGPKREKYFSKARPEQEHQGFPEAENSTNEYYCSMNCSISMRVPKWLRTSLDDVAGREGTTPSNLVRRAFEKHIIELKDIKKLPRGDKEKMSICVTENHRKLLTLKREALSQVQGVERSDADVICAMIVKEFGE